MDKIPSFYAGNDRYIVNELRSDLDAKILHVKLGSNGHDRFGNKVFSSPLSYTDVDGRNIRASILVSKEGQDFVIQNLGILKDVDYGLRTMADKLRSMKEYGDDELAKVKIRVEMDVGRSLTRIGGGNQSNTFLLETAGRRYVVKTLKSLTGKYTDYSQPYINEMLQLQTIKTKFSEDFEKAGMYIPQILLASGYVSISEFADGPEGVLPEDTKKVVELLEKVSSFVAEARWSNSPLWKGINLDWNNEPKYLPHDIKRTPKGYAWVDPLYHDFKFKNNF